VILGLDAMRTRFELVLLGAEPAFLSVAGHEALEEIRATEAQLSIFRRDSWLSRLNADAAGGTAVLVPAQLYALLECCQAVHRASQGAFDPSVGPLLDAHGLRDEAPSWELATESAVGFEAVELLGNRRVRFAHHNLRLDLGGIGKGWALDRAAEVLREAGVPAALLHGGTSTVLSFGAPPEPTSEPTSDSEPELNPTPKAPRVKTRHPASAAGWQIGIEPFCCISLRECALSVSATQPSSRKSRSHVIDPRTQQPLRSKQTAAVCAPTATLADAWSTALLVQSAQPFSWKYLP
jgi:FAD:protein FMN transferase